MNKFLALKEKYSSVKIDENATNVRYIGVSEFLNCEPTRAKWSIIRETKTGGVTTLEYPSGIADGIYIWNNRASIFSSSSLTPDQTVDTGSPPSGAAGGELAGTYPNPTLVNSAVIGKLLTGFVAGSGTVASTDTILEAFQKLAGSSGGGSTNSNKSSNFTAANGFVYVCDLSGGAIQVQFPSPAAGTSFTVKDKLGYASTNNLTCLQFASEKIENVTATKTLASDYGSWTFWCDGTDWMLI